MEAGVTHKAQHLPLLAVDRKGAGVHQPTALAQFAGEVKQAPIARALLQLHGEHRLTGRIADQPQQRQRWDAIGEAAGDRCP